MKPSARLGTLLGAAFCLCAVPAMAFADALPSPGGPPYYPRDYSYVNSRPEVWISYVITIGLALLVPLFLTLLIEVPVVAIAGRGRGRAWAAGVLVNTLTNPVVALAAIGAYLVFGDLSNWTVIAILVALEIAAVVVEWLLLRWALGWTHTRALVTSLIANALSCGLGVLVLTGGSWLY